MREEQLSNQRYYAAVQGVVDTVTVGECLTSHTSILPNYEDIIAKSELALFGVSNIVFYCDIYD